MSLPFSEKCEAKRELGVRLREAVARGRSIQQSLETFRIKSQADAEAMSCRILELLDEAAESVAAEAQWKRDAAIQQLRNETTEQTIEIAERTRLEASVVEMLEGTGAHCNA